MLQLLYPCRTHLSMTLIGHTKKYGSMYYLMSIRRLLVQADIFGRSGRYWGALIVMPGASEKLYNAVNSSDEDYDPSTALHYIWNEMRWPLVGESVVESSIDSAIEDAQSIFASDYASEIISESNLSKTAIQILLNPFEASSTNIYAFDIGIKAFVSTVGFVFPGLIQFFFAMAFGGISAKNHIHSRLSTKTNYIIRLLLSRFWTFIIAISWAGWLFCFAEGRTGVYSHSYILITLDIWMYTMISFEFHDTCAAFVPIEFLPITVLSWVIMNVTAAAYPIPLKSAFFHFDFAVPSYNCFELFITIMSGGSTNRVYRNVPVLFVWMILTTICGVFANRHRCRIARALQAEAEVATDHVTVITESRKSGVSEDMEEPNAESELAHEALGY